MCVGDQINVTTVEQVRGRRPRKKIKDKEKSRAG